MSLFKATVYSLLLNFNATFHNNQILKPTLALSTLLFVILLQWM